MIVGKVISIEYGKLKVRISTEIRGNSANIRGDLYYFGNIGGYLKTFNAVDEVIVCEVHSILDADPKKDNQSFNVESDRDILLKPIGTLLKKPDPVESDGDDSDRVFNLGVGIYPSLYSNVEILTNDDMSRIMEISTSRFVEKNNAEVKHKAFHLGTSKNLINYPIDININKFFSIHSAVLGNSGSGKSNTIAHILQDVLSKSNFSALGAKIILFDVNGEYKSAFESNSKYHKNEKIEITLFNPNDTQDEGNAEGSKPFFLPHFLLNLDEWCSFLLATEATQKPFWSRVLQESVYFCQLAGSEYEKCEFKHYFIHRICGIVENVLSQGDNDTSKMTSVFGLVGAIERLIKTNAKLESISCNKYNEYKEDGKITVSIYQGNDIIVCKKIDCTINAILTGLKDSSQIHYADNKGCLKKTVEEIRKSLCQKKTQKILDKKHEKGAWYSYEFLEIAAEICLIEEDSRGSKNMRNWTSTLMARLDYFIENTECAFMRCGEDKYKNSNSNGYLAKVFGIGENKETEGKTQLFIIDVSALSQDVLEVLTSVTARLIFDYRRGVSKRTEEPVHLILDEAHRYIKKGKDYLLKENIFEKIAREGRKYSYYLLVSSQRPSELSETVLSQCGNYIVHRIQNDEDMRYIQRIMPFFSQDIGEKIKQSIAGEATIFGECVPMPLQVTIKQADPEPNSKNCDISAEWFRPEKDKETRSTAAMTSLACEDSLENSNREADYYDGKDDIPF